MLAPFGGPILALLVLIYFHRSLTKPFWIDEQWRAYEVSRGFFNRAIGANSPLAAGWLLVERIFVAFRNTELIMRIPEALSLAAMNLGVFLLLRRWMTRIPAAIAAGGIVLLGDSIGYSTQLKPYTFEASVTLAIVLGWFALHRRERPSRFAALAYLAMGIGCTFATPAIFIVGPLLAFDAWRLLRSGSSLVRLLPIAAAGAIGLAHLAFFVGQQSNISESNYWNDYFLPKTLFGNVRLSNGKVVHGVFEFIGLRLSEWIPGILRGPRSFGRSTADLANVFGIPFVLGGIWVVARDRRSRGLAFAFGIAFLLQAIASRQRLWTFGYTRTNFFLLPLVWMFAALGVWAAFRWAARTRAVQAVAVALLAAVFAIGSLSLAAAQTRAQHDHQKTVAYAAEMDQVLAFVRPNAEPNDIAVVIHQQGHKGWQYYMHFYDGYPESVANAAQISDGRTLFVHRLKETNIATFARRFPDASHLWMFVLRGGNVQTLGDQEAELRTLGLCRSFRKSWRVTGTIILYARGEC